MTEVTLADLRRAQDLELETGPWFRVDQERIDAFAGATEDHQWIHTDPERAAAGPFGGTVAHGYLTLSLIPWMISEVLTITDRGAGINYGLEKLRFPAPVRTGSEVRLRACVVSGAERKGGVLYRVKAEVEIRGSDRPAMVADLLYMAFPK